LSVPTPVLTAARGRDIVKALTGMESPSQVPLFAWADDSCRAQPGGSMSSGSPPQIVASEVG